MKNYQVKIRVTEWYYVDYEANDESEAEELAREDFADGKILDYDDVELTYEATELTK